MYGMKKNVGPAEALLALRPGSQFLVRDNDYSTLEWFSDDDPPTEEEINAKVAELEAEAPLNALREIRDWLLQGSDWTQGHDIRELRGPEWCAAWDAYRQELRDITEAGFDLDFNEMGGLIGFELPTPPAR